jgi:hypothetical protein
MEGLGKRTSHEASSAPAQSGEEAAHEDEQEVKNAHFGSQVTGIATQSHCLRTNNLA